VFHIGFEADVDEADAAAAGIGLNVLARGQRDNGSGFIYFDTADDAGVVLLARKTAT
jgi:methylmalonyl-CoA/ethylmalonyl-CoA epimerase